MGPDDEDDNLLVDSREAFILSRKLLTEAARCFVQAPQRPPDPARPTYLEVTYQGLPITPPPPPPPPRSTSPTPSAHSAHSSPIRLGLVGGPRLPDGSLPALSSPPPTQPMQPAVSGLALLDAIHEVCRGLPLPDEIMRDSSFSFLREA
jgi:hypothetical protein